MVIRRAVFFAAIVSTTCLLGQRAQADLITNGNFETGTLAGWTVFTTPNGTNGAGLPNVVSFNTTGSGASDAAHFNVGEVTFNSTQQGGGLSQTISAPTNGLYTLTEDFASKNASTVGNSGAGTFSLVIDGTTVATDTLGTILAGQTLMGSFDVSVDLAAGPHTFETEITRAFTSDTITPNQYIDNISLTPGVPEPSTLLLLGTGIVGAVEMTRRKAAALR